MIEALIAMVRYLSARNDDDAVDRLHYLYTPNILLAFAVLISFKQFGGRPIECMFPNKFPGSWEQYAENYCWSQDTYYVQDDVHVANIPVADRYSPNRQLSYYKWVPFFLLLQAAFFRLPSVLWNYLSLASGIRIHEVLEKAIQSENIEESIRMKNINLLTKHMQNALKFHRRILKNKIEVHKKLKFLNVRYSAFFISLMYLFIKTLYMANAVAQFYILNRFLRTDVHQWYGLSVVSSIVSGTEWEFSSKFPRVSLCDFAVRQVGNIQRYSVQCVLVINLFNEKIFLFLWFWYTILAVVTLFSLIYWISVLTFPCFSRWFISQNLELSELNLDPDSKRNEIDRFVSKYLHHDGVFILRLVSLHAGVIFCCELVMSLWKAFYELEEQIGILENKNIEEIRKKTCQKFQFSEGRSSADDRQENTNNLVKQRNRLFGNELLQFDTEPKTLLMPADSDGNC